MVEFDRNKLIEVVKGYKHIIKSVFSKEEVIQLIEENKFQELFDKKICGASIITSVLLLSDIDFLPHIIKLPPACFLALPVTKIHLPNNIKEISFEAFTGCRRLNELSFSNSVKFIAAYSFSSSKIKTITFNGTEEDFNNILKDAHWNSNSKLEAVYCIGDSSTIILNKDK